MAKERQKVRQGRVVSDKMDRTVVVAIVWSQRHRLYRKPVRRVTKFYAHDQDNRCRIGDLVSIQETRPISRLKRWRVIDIVERHDVIDLQPAELGQEELAEVTAPATQTSTLQSPEETSISEDLEETTPPQNQEVSEPEDNIQEPTEVEQEELAEVTEPTAQTSAPESLEETTPPQDQEVSEPEDNIQEPTEVEQEELDEVTEPTAQTSAPESLEETTPPQDQEVPQPEDNIQEPTESPDPTTLDEEDKD
jgi:small subunit ribosomal protein S17